MFVCAQLHLFMSIFLYTWQDISHWIWGLQLQHCYCGSASNAVNGTKSFPKVDGSFVFLQPSLMQKHASWQRLDFFEAEPPNPLNRGLRLRFLPKLMSVLSYTCWHQQLITKAKVHWYIHVDFLHTRQSFRNNSLYLHCLDKFESVHFIMLLFYPSVFRWVWN